MSAVKLSVACPQCGAILRYSPDIVGSVRPCQGCGHRITLPSLPPDHLPPLTLADPPEPPPDRMGEVLEQLARSNSRLKQISDNVGCMGAIMVIWFILTIIAALAALGPR